MKPFVDAVVEVVVGVFASDGFAVAPFVVPDLVANDVVVADFVIGVVIDLVVATAGLVVVVVAAVDNAVTFVAVAEAATSFTADCLVGVCAVVLTGTDCDVNFCTVTTGDCGFIVGGDGFGANDVVDNDLGIGIDAVCVFVRGVD